ncbi:hypothetical protein PHMEG_00010350 [Phytophthora megakarya]|uniref:Uncharacterized protein n=1 Tax=Phytophthora megakarya TaxID=4795 RepID=A0A225WFY4_9STRA|nr:hypothetical protein PHMEG_00010350 [Phytophthora megakarya]
MDSVIGHVCIPTQYPGSVTNGSGLGKKLLIYHSIINNCLWGYASLPPEEETMVDPEVLEFLDFEPQEP